MVTEQRFIELIQKGLDKATQKEKDEIGAILISVLSKLAPHWTLEERIDMLEFANQLRAR